MEKNQDYWRLHKKEYELHFDCLEKGIKEIIAHNPKSEEAISLNIIVDKAIWESMKKGY